MIRRIALACLLVASAAAAAGDEPSAAYLFPAGGQRGTTVVFRLGGHYLHEGCPFEMLGPGVHPQPQVRRIETVWFEGPLIPLPASQQKEDYPKDYEGSVEIAADAPLGLRYWRLSTSQGATPARKFMVGDLPELVERETDGEAIAVAVALPVTVNGRIFPREDVDRWSFEARRGQTIRAEVHAARLGSPLVARLEVLDPAGHPIAENTGAAAGDARLSFTAPSDGLYQARIHDMQFGGLQDYVYRLTLAAGPLVEATYPLGGRRGSQVRLELAGEGLPGDPVDVPLPADGPRDYACRLDVAGRATNEFLLELDDLAEVVEAEPNDAPAPLVPVTLPAVLNGRIGSPGDVDCWAVAAKAQEVWQFDLRAARLGSPLDSVLVVADSSGKELARSDDIGGDQTDSELAFTVPSDGTYLLRVEERFASRGGRTFAYRLRAAPGPAPDFRLSLATDAVTLYRGAQAKLKITAQRLGQFQGPIALALEGLPPGVTLSGSEIPANQPQAEITLAADNSAPIRAGHLVVRGSADIGAGQVTRTATLPAGRGEPEVEQVLLAVGMPTPFAVVGRYDVTFAPRGTVHRRHYTIERGGFEGPLEVRLADRQMRHLQGVIGPTITIPAGQSECHYPVFLPPWMELGRTSRSVVMAIGVVQDADGSRHVVSFTSQAQNEQIVVLVSPGLLTVRLDQQSVAARPGGTAEVALHVARHKSVAVPVKLELVVPGHISGISADPVTLSADQDEGKLALRFASELGPLNMPLVVRSTAMVGDYPVVAETQLEVVAARP